MSGRRVFISFTLILSTLFLVSPRVMAQQEKVLYNFPAHGGGYPAGSLVFDGSGNLYGTGQAGGTLNLGSVFELKPSANGTWTGTTLHLFGSNLDGQSPASGLLIDSSGNLYGTTPLGGTLGDGTAYKLARTSNGGWKETVIYNFGTSAGDGLGPDGPLISDAAGNLYGTTGSSGSGGGAVFVLSPKAGGGWTEKIIYLANSIDVEGLVFDSTGNLYGTDLYHFGQVFKLTPNGDGTWSGHIVYNFKNTNDGLEPFGALAMDAQANLYGETYYGGTGTACYQNCGEVYELVRGSNGSYTKKTLHNFTDGADGSAPVGGVILDAAGNLYGVTMAGGDGPNCGGCGTIFELSPTSNGWSEKILHVFDSNGTDGYFPEAGLIFDNAGNLYGTAANGGVNNKGVVFEITP